MVTVLFVSTTSSSRRRNNINNSSKVLLVLLVGVASLAPHVHPFSSFRGGPRRRRQHTISSAFLALPIINNKDPSSSSSWLASSALKLYRDFKQSGGPKETDHWKTNQPVPPRQPTTTTTTTATTTTTSHWTQRIAAIGLLSAALLFSAPTTAWAENELSAKYGGGLDTSLVDQTCLVDYCSLQAKSCLQDDPSCRKGLTCTAKCLGDNACITGCMARYGNERLDDLLKCTIEDHDCIKVAILPGGADSYGTEPRAPAPTVPQFNVHSMEGSWFKVVGYNPNYDCYACQRNSFSTLGGNGDVHNNNNKEQQLQLDVEFSMPHLLPDGSPPPPSGVQESVLLSLTDDSSSSDSRNGGGLQSMALNDYRTHEVMVFDNPSVNYNGNTNNPWQKLVLNKGNPTEATYARTAHSEGEMFGLSTFAREYAYIFIANLIVDATAEELTRILLFLSLDWQNSGRTGILLVKTIRTLPNSSLCITMERLDKTPTKAPLSTVAPRNSHPKA